MKKFLFLCLTCVMILCVVQSSFIPTVFAQARSVPFVTVSTGISNTGGNFIAVEVSVADWVFTDKGYSSSEINSVKENIMVFLESEKTLLTQVFNIKIQASEYAVEIKNQMLNSLTTKVVQYSSGTDVLSLQLIFSNGDAFKLFVEYQESEIAKNTFITKISENISSHFLKIGEKSFQNRLIESTSIYCKNTLLKDIPSEIIEAVETYEYYNLRKRVHSNAGSIEFSTSGQYCHTWKISAKESLNAVIHINNANGVYWYIISIAITFTFLMVALIINKAKHYQSNKQKK